MPDTHTPQPPTAAPTTRYRKAVEVTALQWTGTNRDEVLAFVGSFRSKTTFTDHDKPLVQIRMSDWQVMEVPVGDWLVEEPIGGVDHIRHVWASEFAAAYEPIEQAEDQPAPVTINGKAYEVLEWDWRDVDDEGVVTWHLYAREIDEQP